MGQDTDFASPPGAGPGITNVTALEWAARQNVRQATAKLLLIQLATMADNDFSCRASIQTLATHISKQNGAARNALRVLENLGLITCHSQFGTDGSRLANRYNINHPDAHQVARPKESKHSDTVPPTDMEGTSHKSAKAAFSLSSRLDDPHSGSTTEWTVHRPHHH